jgi:hypothetical protein
MIYQTQGKDPGGSMNYVVGLPNNSYMPIAIQRGFTPSFVNYKLEAPRSL